MAPSDVTSLGIGAGIAIAASALLFVSIVSLIYYVLIIIAEWKILVKAGEKGWKSLIPIYNAYIAFKLFWNTKQFWILIAVACLSSLLSTILVNASQLASALISSAAGIYELIVIIIFNNRLAKSFGHGTGFTLGLIFLPNIFTLILGFNKDKYKKLAD